MVPQEINVQDTLIAFAGLGVAIAGFSGIAVSLKKWDKRERLARKTSLLKNLLYQSFSVLALSLLALIVLHWEPKNVPWWALSAAWGLMGVATNLYFWNHVRTKDQSARPAATYETLALYFCVFLQAVVIVDPFKPGPFLVGLTYLVGSAAVSFLRLLFLLTEDD